MDDKELAVLAEKYRKRQENQRIYQKRYVEKQKVKKQESEIRIGELENRIHELEEELTKLSLYKEICNKFREQFPELVDGVAKEVVKEPVKIKMPMAIGPFVSLDA